MQAQPQRLAAPAVQRTRDGLVEGLQAVQQGGGHLAELQRVEVRLQQGEDLQGRWVGGWVGGGRTQGGLPMRWGGLSADLSPPGMQAAQGLAIRPHPCADMQPHAPPQPAQAGRRAGGRSHLLDLGRHQGQQPLLLNVGNQRLTRQQRPPVATLLQGCRGRAAGRRRGAGASAGRGAPPPASPRSARSTVLRLGATTPSPAQPRHAPR